MNQLRIICRQESPELKSDYDPYIFRRIKEWIEIDIRGRIDIIQITDGQGNPIDVELMNGRPITEAEAAELVEKYAKPSDDSDIEAAVARNHEEFARWQASKNNFSVEDAEAAREAARSKADILKHGPHHLDPTKPLLDD